MMLQARSTAVVALCVLLLHVGALWALHRGLTTRPHAVSPQTPLQLRLLAAAAADPHAPLASDAERTRAIALQQPAPPKRLPQALGQDRPPARPRVARNTVPAAARPGDPAAQGPKLPSTAAEATPMPVQSSIAPAQGTPAGPGLATDPGVVKPSGTADAGANGPAPAPARAALAGPASAATQGHPVPLQWPSSDASYLQNQPPRYPPISKKLGEQGTVLVDVLVTDQGLARDARLHTSSGFYRLDQAAVAAVSSWRFVPGKRAGVAQTMRFTVTIVFELQ